jgi:hypothetical protein
MLGREGFGMQFVPYMLNEFFMVLDEEDRGFGFWILGVGWGDDEVMMSKVRMRNFGEFCLVV